MTEQPGQARTPESNSSATAAEPAKPAPWKGPQAAIAKTGRVEKQIPGCPEPIALEMNEGHEIMVDRPSAWGSGFREAPEKYVWEGNVPKPGDKSGPGKGRYSADDQAWSEPIVAVMRVNRPNRKISKEDRADASKAWDELWQEFGPHLNERAAKMCDLYDFDSRMYTVLCKRPDITDILTTCPALGPFMNEEAASQIPTSGWALAQAAAFLLARPGETQPAKPSSGFMAWARNLKWEASRLPPFPKEAQARVQHMRAFVKLAHEAGPKLDPNGIQQIPNENAWKKVNFPMDEDKAWLLLNSALASRATSRLAGHILKSPAAAAKAVDKFFPDGVRLNYRQKVGVVLETVNDWVITADRATKIAGTSGVLERYPAFARLAEEAKQWDQAMRAEDLRIAQEREAEIARREADQDLQAQLAHERAMAVIDRARERGATYLLPETIDPSKEFPVKPNLYRLGGEKWQMVFLGTGALLQEESVMMNHCVAAFHAQGCVEGNKMFFSVRNAESVIGQPLATVSINPKTGRINEARGKNNGSLSAEMDAFIKEGVERIMAAGIILDHVQKPRARAKAVGA